ncbi:hypothetical protein UNH65_32630 [Chitinophaga sp. 180180018-2]|nr:hypothetical protein [Chitinophaga sp. 212800010-3]
MLDKSEKVNSPEITSDKAVVILYNLNPNVINISIC